NPDVVDVRGRKVSGTGMKVGVGSVVILIGVVLASRLFGVDLSSLVGSGGGGGTSGPSTTKVSTQSDPLQGNDPDAERIERIKDVMLDIQDTIEGVFKANGKTYRRAKLLIFKDTIDTGCGRSSSAIGPFYCPPDEIAYIDLSFFRDLEERFKAAGDFAGDYVLAHEIGHHMQTVLGIEKETRKVGRGTRNEMSVRQELQADCYAGVWGHSAAQRGKLEEGDLDEALTAANAIGDDRLQKQSGREVDPETFTHGTSEQRKKWFKRGFDSGRLDACDTFSVDP
ncbi:MAG TPA: neutral zinc metallopeptidase, partial [Kofleriaceae bacterium]